MLASYLCNGLLFTQNVESIYRDLWKQWLETRSPTQSEGESEISVASPHSAEEEAALAVDDTPSSKKD